MSYGILINNELEYAQSRYTTDEGQLIVNFDKNIEVMAQHGFKIVVDEKPEYNKDLQSLSIVGYEETDDSITPPIAIKNFVPKIVPVRRLASITRIILTVTISPLSNRLIVIRAIILARPKRMPKGSDGRKAFSAMFITIARAVSMVTYVSFLVLFIDHHYQIIRQTDNRHWKIS